VATAPEHQPAGPPPAPALRKMERMRPLVRTFWRDLAYQASGLPAAMLACAVVIAGVTVALTATGVIIGIPLVVAVFAVLRWNARIERRRAGWMLRERIPEAYRPRSGNVLTRLRIVGTDPQSWKDLAWLTILGSLGFAVSVMAVVLWGVTLGMLSLPAWYWSLPEPVEFGLFQVDSVGTAFLATDLGLVAIPILYVLQRWATEGMVRLSSALLSPSREAALRTRVEELAATRAGVVDAATAELQRIERDLHDGAQARLVALALDLGMAEERFARDPEGALALVGEAREEAKRALAELRQQPQERVGVALLVEQVRTQHEVPRRAGQDRLRLVPRAAQHVERDAVPRGVLPCQLDGVGRPVRGEHPTSGEDRRHAGKRQPAAELERAGTVQRAARHVLGERDAARPQLGPVREELLVLEGLLVEQRLAVARAQDGEVAPGEHDRLLHQVVAHAREGWQTGGHRPG
jgi:signal transduction histidine kinase